MDKVIVGIQGLANKPPAYRRGSVTLDVHLNDDRHPKNAGVQARDKGINNMYRSSRASGIWTERRIVTLLDLNGFAGTVWVSLRRRRRQDAHRTGGRSKFTTHSTGQVTSSSHRLGAAHER